MSNHLEDKREKRLRNLSDLLKGIDRSDMELTMSQLSLEFYRQATLAEGRGNTRYLKNIRSKKT